RRKGADQRADRPRPRSAAISGMNECSPPPCGEGQGWGVSMPSAMDPKTTARARRLRKSMTEGEKRFWSELKVLRGQHGVHFRKQAPLGAYVADFLSHQARLVVEIDGEHHFMGDAPEKDRRRDAWMQSQGYRVVRFTTGDFERQ